MITSNKAVQIINKYLEKECNSMVKQDVSVSVSSLRNNIDLCDKLIDFLGDLYVRKGLDTDYEENICGTEIQEVIHFLAFCRGQGNN